MDCSDSMIGTEESLATLSEVIVMRLWRVEKLLAEAERQLAEIVGEDLVEMMDWRNAREDENDRSKEG